MNIKILKEAGYEEALLGLSLSYNSEPSERVAQKLAHRDGGHNKFLESIVVWLDVIAPRYWWQQFDTYRIGTTKQSESTMHTLMRNPLTQENFQGGCDQRILDVLNKWRDSKSLIALKSHLPESFLQRRVICTNYKTLRNICWQRWDHKLPEWQLFIKSLEDQLDHTEFLGNYNDSE